MVKNIFSIGYHHNMFIIEIIVNTDIAAVSYTHLTLPTNSRV